MKIKGKVIVFILLILICNSCGVFTKQPKLYNYDNNEDQMLSNNIFTYGDGYRNYIKPMINKEANIFVICIPGLGAHAGTYKYLQQYFYQNKISSVAIDLRGFGHTEGKKGDIKNIGLHIADINQVIDYYKTRYPKKQYILLGESLGSSLAIWYANLYPEKINGLILTSLVTNKGEGNVEIKSILKLFFAYCFYPTKPIELGYEPNVYSNDTIFNNWAFEEDTLGTNAISVRYLIQANRVIKKSYKQLCNQNNTLLMQGGNDFLSELDEVEKIYKQCNGDKIIFEFYENNNHSLVNDLNRLQIYNAMISWMHN